MMLNPTQLSTLTNKSMEYLANLYRISGEDMLSLISANENVRMKC